jgi:ferrous iron transport protein B
LARLKSADQLENSYIGILGHAIEPAIAPLGYDWKIGIALITSFAAREVFVGTMATIYAVGDSEDVTTILTVCSLPKVAIFSTNFHTKH